MFIDEILKAVCAKLNHENKYPIYIEMEAELRVFNEVIRPDYQLMLQSSLSVDTPLFVIEVKRTDQQNLKDHFDQHFKQLRHICITHSLPEVFGTLTNYRRWFFTRYDL